MADEFKVRFYDSNPVPKITDVNVRAESAEDAKRQAQAIHPSGEVRGAPIRQSK